MSPSEANHRSPQEFPRQSIRRALFFGQPMVMAHKSGAAICALMSTRPPPSRFTSAWHSSEARYAKQRRQEAKDNARSGQSGLRASPLRTFIRSGADSFVGGMSPAITMAGFMPDQGVKPGLSPLVPGEDSIVHAGNDAGLAVLTKHTAHGRRNSARLAK